MPTILRQNGFSFIVYPNDHRPAHVHVFKAESELILYLGDETAPPFVRENIRMGKRDERLALIIAGENQEYLLSEWEKIHG